MAIELSEKEARVIGCLMEKSVVTPDQYPMTLNALTNACNQKSSREPVMNLESGMVLGTLRSLQDKHLVRVEENFKTQVEKFTQRLCNTPFSDYQFDEAQFAIMTVLLLRGPRTPGELKANVGRLHTFADNEEVQETLNTLMDREGGAVVVQLPRKPGRRDNEYVHLLSGPVTAAAQTASSAQPQASVRRTVAPEETSASPAGESAAASEAGNQSDLMERLAALESEVVGLKKEIAELKAELGIN
jgi:uncharacterized protein YceH (UPF0502 family)